MAKTKNGKKTKPKVTVAAVNDPVIRLGVNALANEVENVTALAALLNLVLKEESEGYDELQEFIEQVARAKEAIEGACNAWKGNPMYRDFEVG